MKNIKLFPSIEEVFQNPTEEYKAVFFPLLTIDLNEIGKGNGKVHFLTVNGNGDPEIEIPGTEFGYNFIKFKIIGDKYRFDGDISKMPNILKTLEWYKEAEEIYNQNKERYFSKTGGIKEEDQKRYKLDKEYSYYIEGVTNYWVTRDKFLETGKFIQGSAYTYGNSNQEREIFTDIKDDDEYDYEYFEELLEELGFDFNKMNIIGYVTAYNYCEFGEDEILLSINPETNEVLQYFNWS